MNKWTFVALVAAIATVLGATVFREQVARAAQTVDANIIGPLDGQGDIKVHEQGTAKVSATQAGEWATRDRDNPALQPYGKLIFSFDIPDGEYTHSVELQAPRGKRLVIEDVSAGAQGPTGQTFTIAIFCLTNGESVLRTFTGTEISPSTSGHHYTLGSETRLYVDPGSTFTVQFLRDSPQLAGVFHIIAASLSGYLVDVPTAGAAAAGRVAENVRIVRSAGGRLLGAKTTR